MALLGRNFKETPDYESMMISDRCFQIKTVRFFGVDSTQSKI